MKNKINILYTMILLLGMCACNEDLLNVENRNTINSSTFWNTVDDIQKGLTATYSQFYRVGNWSRWIYFRYDLTSDEGYSNSGWTEMANWTKFSYSNYDFLQGGYTIYKSHYKQIYEANQVIHYGEALSVESESAQDSLNQIVAQAKFIRAFDYFNLEIMFGKLEIVLEPSEAGDNYEVGDSTAIYAIIIQDLEDAIEYLPEEWTGEDKGRIAKGAAYALLGKVYMQMHEWEKAKNVFYWLVEGSGTQYYGLMDNYNDNFTHYKENNIESVFEIQFSDVNETEMDRDNSSSLDDDVANMSMGNSRSQFFSPKGWQDGKVRAWLVDEYKKELTVDKSVNGTLIDDRLRVSIYYPDIFKDFPEETAFNGTVSSWQWTDLTYFRKYNDDYFKSTPDYYSPINYRVIRYADVLLCYAECLAHLDELSKAITYVDQVRTRPSTNHTTLANSPIAEIAESVNSTSAFLERLQMERALELCLESVRWIDLRRWGLLETQEGIDELKSRDPDFENFVIGKNEILPLPQFEVDNNPNLSQNPGY